jgi:signal transduction histidine kinase
MKVKFSIRFKFLAVSTSLLVLCVGAYLWLATSEFSEDKKSLVFDYQKTIVTNVGRDVERLIETLGDKLQLSVWLREGHIVKSTRVLNEIFEDSGDVVAVGIKLNNSDLDRFYYLNKVYFQTYGMNADTLNETIFKNRPIPHEELLKNGMAIWNATVENGPALLGYGKTVIVENENGVPVNSFNVVALFKADRLIKSVEQGELSEVLIAHNGGEILVHANPEFMKNPTLINDAMLKDAIKSNLKTSVKSYNSEQTEFLGGYNKILDGRVIVLSRVPYKNAFRAVNRLIFRSLLFATTIVTLAFFVTIFFSRSLTRPLDSLMKGMRKVSEGNLQEQIRVDTQDELALLAVSFNHMIRDLKNSREELENINQELEAKVIERTKELAAQNLAVKEAQEALLRSTRLAAVGEVAGQAAHQVLNPLTSIISRLRKVRSRIDNERQQEIKLLLDIENSWEHDYAQGGFQKLVDAWKTPSTIQPQSNLWNEDITNIKNISQNTLNEFQAIISDTDFLIGESERITRIINSFRSMSSVSGEVKNHSLVKLCENSVRIMADLAQKENIQLKIENHLTTDLVSIDEDEFIQVITNLLRNSIHAVKENREVHAKNTGYIKLTLRQDTQSAYVVLRDNGSGIDQKYHAQMFEKNFTTKSRAEGTGIGLSISRRLMRAFHGDIKLTYSEKNKGTEFEIRLPLAQSSESRGVA